KTAPSITIIHHIVMHQGSCMDKLYHRSTTIGPLAHLSIVHHFGDQEHEHWPHLFAFSIDNISSNPIKKRYFTRHGKQELLFEKFHLVGDGLFYLFNDFQRKKQKVNNNKRTKNGNDMLLINPS